MARLLCLGRGGDPMIEDVADRHRAGAQINPEDAALALVTRGDEAIFARLLRGRTLARGITERHADRILLEAVLAGANLASGAIKPVDAIEIGFGRCEEFVVCGK